MHDKTKVSESSLSLYEPHPGTIRVSAGTPYEGLSKSIVRMYETALSGSKSGPKIEKIDLAFFGMAAGYQAFRGADLAAGIIFQKYSRKIAFMPAMMKAKVIAKGNVVTDEVRDAGIWRMIELES